MNLKVLLDNIDRLRERDELSDHALSLKSGKEDAIRNLRRYASGEIKGIWTLDTLEAVAKALRTTSWELLRPPGAVAADQDFEDRVNRLIDQRMAPPNTRAKRGRKAS